MIQLKHFLERKWYHKTIVRETSQINYINCKLIYKRTKGEFIIPHPEDIKRIVKHTENSRPRTSNKHLKNKYYQFHTNSYRKRSFRKHIPIHFKLLGILCRKDILCSGKNITRKNYTPTSLMNTCKKSFNKMLDIESNNP